MRIFALNFKRFLGIENIIVARVTIRVIGRKPRFIRIIKITPERTQNGEFFAVSVINIRFPRRE